MKIDWTRKLSSRKFWALLAALVVSLLTSFGAGPESIQRITATITAAGACAIYMLAEAHTDAGGKQESITLETVNEIKAEKGDGE
jgi:hypothetical protein